MRAVMVDPSERRLVLSEVPAPTPGTGQLLVRVQAAGVNRADLAITAGSYHGTAAPAPFVAGGELAGEVVEVGDGITDWRPGDRVMAMARGCAELAAVDASVALPVPDSLDIVVAGALPVALATMHDALVTNGHVVVGDHVVVNAASSGVGVVGVRMALVLGGAVVIGTSRSADKRRQLVDLVADERFTAVTPEDLVATASELTDGHGIDVVVDNVGASALTDNIAVAALGGRIVQVGRLGGRRAEIDLDELARKRISLVGVTFRTRNGKQRTAVVQRAWAEMAESVAAGAVLPVVHETYPLEAVAAAHEALAEDRHVGKLVIIP
ncbi:MAG: zinc-binding dehydrogenase [Ilumatobacteraceae bacterium]